MRVFAAILLSLAAGQAVADASAQASDAALSPQWLRLLHYRPDSASVSGWRSAVTSPGFFLSADGATDPRRELAATLAALAAPAAGDPDAHAQCRFPARDLWLRRTLALDERELPRVECPALRAWLAGEDPQAVSLVFAAGYLGNLPSYFGHILLRFDAPPAVRQSHLLDVTVNYGASIPIGVDPFTLIASTFVGNYKGYFFQAPYFQPAHHYSDSELRDLWEYRLDLEPYEVRLLAAHAWEMLDRSFRYFFLRGNCADRIAELLEILDGVRVRPVRPWTLPQALVQNVAGATRAGRPLLADVTYRPSRQVRFHHRFLQLDGEGRRAVARAVASAEYLSSPEFASLAPERAAAVVDAAMDYFEFRRASPGPASRNQPLEAAHAAALATRFALPPQAAPTPAPPLPPLLPHASRRPGLVSGGAVRDRVLGTGTALALRTAYYDPLDAGAAHIVHSGLAIMDTRVAVYADELRVERVDLLSLESVTPSVSGLPGDGGETWTLSVGAAQQYAACPADCLAFGLDASVGRALQWGPGLLAGAQVGAALHDNRNGEGKHSARADVYTELAIGPRLRAKLRYRHRVALSGELLEPDMTLAQVRLRLDANSDLRLEYRRDVVDQTRLTLGWYW